jgi:2-hydroxy-3-oxopropionate reductase
MEGGKANIGFIGLGIMGKPMVRNLLKAGYIPRVYNRSQAAVGELVAEGVFAASSPKNVAEQSDIVITMLPDSPDVEAVVLGSDGVLEGAKEGLLLIDMSTISPVVTRSIAVEAERSGVRMLDAPVSGGDKGAIAGTLSIMAGGEAKDFERALPLFEAMGKTIRHCGPVGSGQVVKACNQIVVAIVIEAVSEALVLGSKAGVNPEIILQVLSGGLAQNRVMDLRGPTMINHDFTPGFKARLHRKDMKIILETAREFGVALPVSALVDQMFTSLVAKGDGDLDHSALLTVIEELSDHFINEA